MKNETIKNGLKVLLMAVIFSSCKEQKNIKTERQCYLIVKNSNNFGSECAIVECDSFQMNSTKKAVAWVDGHKLNIEAENVIFPNAR